MNQEKYLKLIKLEHIYFLNKTSKLILNNGYVEIGDEGFIAVGFEKSKAAKNWEDTDYFNIIILAKAADGNYYLSRIEHPADILAPKYVDDDLSIHWVEENTELDDNLLIDNLYTLDDSRCKYTLTIHDKPYQFYEKYIIYKISASYKIWKWKNHDKTTEISPYLKVRCKFDSQHSASALENTPTKILEYSININSLLQTSIFKLNPFEIYQRKVTIDGLIITLESEKVRSLQLINSLLSFN